MTADDDPARDLLLRDHIEIMLLVDADAARDLPDELLARVLGAEACRMVRDYMEER